MPNTPPGGDEEHAAVVTMPNLTGEDARVEEQDQPQSRILDTDLHRQRTTICHGQFAQKTSHVTRAECTRIVNQHNEEDIDDMIQMLDETLEAGAFRQLTDEEVEKCKACLTK